MNPFDNNKPNLSASELIRNKRDRTIYNTEKTDFQSKTILKIKKKKKKKKILIIIEMEKFAIYIVIKLKKV